MASLIYTGPDGQSTVLPLKAGVNRIGRVEGNDILVPDNSVAENHCEVIVNGTAVSVRDLGSTTGTAINGAPVLEGNLLAGETLQVGNVQFTLQEDLASAAPPFSAPPEVIPGQACQNHADVPAKWRCSKCARQFCDACVLEGRQFGVAGVKFCPVCKSQANKIGAAAPGGRKAPGEMTFGGEMLAAWAYPFRGNGWVIMLTGTVFFAIAGFAQRYAFLMSLFVYVMSTGYWMAYVQKVVSASANGDDEPPGWPDFGDFFDDIFTPFLQAMGLFIVYLLPAWLVIVFLPKEEVSTYVIAGGLLLVGLFMMPMAWLAISMHETIAGLSPHVVIPSIMRIPGHYFAIFIELLILVSINVALEAGLDMVAIPFLGALISSFLGIYFGMVICRLLGSLYFLNRDRLGWF